MLEPISVSGKFYILITDSLHWKNHHLINCHHHKVTNITGAVHNSFQKAYHCDREECQRFDEIQKREQRDENHQEQSNGSIHKYDLTTDCSWLHFEQFKLLTSFDGIAFGKMISTNSNAGRCKELQW